MRRSRISPTPRDNARLVHVGSKTIGTPFFRGTPEKGTVESTRPKLSMHSASLTIFSVRVLAQRCAKSAMLRWLVMYWRQL